MFTVNAINKTISTKSKIGDTWYQYSDYIVENNKPKLFVDTQMTTNTLHFIEKQLKN